MKKKRNEKSRLILVIDDEDDVRNIFRMLLESEGFRVREACDGEEGIHLFKKDPADIVITDIIMPRKNGFEVIEELRRLNPEVKIIVISGSHVCDSGLVRNGKPLEVDAALHKPIEIYDLLSEVKRILGE